MYGDNPVLGFYANKLFEWSKFINSILYSDCQIHFSASTKHVIKGHQTITNYTLNLGGFDSANWPTRM